VPKLSFSSENKAAGQETFPKLRLDQEESARVNIYEAPTYGYVHNIRAPKLINGQPQFKTVKTKDGEREEMDFDFIGNPICLGDLNVLGDRGMDPKNCPACKAAQEDPDMFAPPKRRFAMHVFQYTTNGTSKPTKNFQGSVKVWAFTDQKYAEIVDLAEEAPGGEIGNIDIILGPCENKLFQKYKMISSTQVKKDESEASQKAFEEITSENQAKDLENFLGRPVKKREYLEDDLDKVRTRWRIVNGQSNETNSDNQVGAERNLDAGLDKLLDNDSKPEAYTPSATKVEDKPVESRKEAVDLEDLLNGL
jgi:hypothetical protein